MNSSVSGFVLAIENERWCSVPGIVMSTYWPGLNSSGSSGLSLRPKMSDVSDSTDSTTVETVRGGVPPWMISSS